MIYYSANDTGILGKGNLECSYQIIIIIIHYLLGAN